MDTSETYIKMCERAVEIQGERELIHGDYYAYLRPKEGTTWSHSKKIHADRQFHLDNPEPVASEICYGWDDELHHTFSDTIEHCWLPRQDQLQEMVLPNRNAKDAWGLPIEGDSKIDHAFWLAKKFADSIQERKWSQQTMEQLWLRFVMHEKHGKVWDGEDWVKRD